VTPQLKIENGFWMLSTDNGETWTNMGTAVGGDGDSFFQNVWQDENYVFMQLKDGTLIQLPKEKPLSITFDESVDIAITGGATKTLNYTVTGATDETVVKAMGQNGWRAKATPVDNTTGTITVTAPDPLTDDEVLVWVYDGKTKTIMSSLNFVTGEITVASNAYSLPRAAGSQEVKVETNIDYVVDIPDDAQSWLSVSSTRSAMRTDTLTFHLTENKGFVRYATVALKNNAGKVLQTIAFEQAGGALSVNVETPGTLSTLITEEQKQNTVILVLTGVLNNDDYNVIKNMPSLENVDMSSILNTTISASIFENNKVIKEVKLPTYLTAIPEKLFNNSSIQVCAIPSQVSYIGLLSFGGCTELVGRLTLPSELKTIGMSAFFGCSKLSGNLILPEKVISVGSLAFSGCNNIEKIYSKNPAAPSLETSVFPNYNYLGVPIGAKESYMTAESGPSHDKWSMFAVIEEVDFSNF
ncbi:MAG TPA: leucine-rich repeat protein, partial [Bacteroidales bacterium]|nr:leucine-rich repeat protein [Bacteroidales bacterium]